MTSISSTAQLFDVRFLLHITGDEDGFFSAPLDHPSVARVQLALADAATHKCKRDANIGLGVLAMALRNRLTSNESTNVYNAREMMSNARVGDRPFLSREDADFNYIVDIDQVISFDDVLAWRAEDRILASRSAKQLYVAVHIKDCV